MKPLSLLCATLAFPASIALAQTPPPPDTSSELPYLPLFGSTSSTNGTATNSTWFVDTARNQVVLCTATAGGGGTGPQTFTCSAQPIPTTSTPAPGAPAPGGGSPDAGAGGAGANPMGG